MRPLERPTDLACSFCGREQRAVRKLIPGPGVYVCDACADRALVEGPAQPLPHGRCSFCGAHSDRAAWLFLGVVAPPDRSKGARGDDESGERTAICDACVTLCREILAEELGEEPLEVQVETSALITAREPAKGGPRCAGCRSPLGTTAGIRTIDVPDGGGGRAIGIAVVFCTACGRCIGIGGGVEET